MKSLVLGVIGTLLGTGLALLPSAPAPARTHFSFWLNLGVPLGPFPGYGYLLPYP